MANRRSTLLLAGALVFSAALLPGAAAHARPAQDPGATFGGAGTESTTTLPLTSTTAAGATTTEPDGSNQTLVEPGGSSDEPLWSENNRLKAIIGGLVLVALALLILTIRYIRVTKPVLPAAEEGLPMLPPTLELNDESVFVVASTDVSQPSQPVVPTVPEVSVERAIAPTTAEVMAIPVPGSADHDAADSDWEPRTGEHERVEIAAGAQLVRPGLAARRKALGVDQG